MKQLNLFVNIVFIGILVIAFACSTSTDPEDGDLYPFNVQTWKVNSGEQADWIGSSSTKKESVSKFKSDSSEVDTTLIFEPEKYGLEITESFEDTLFNIQFIDSTYWAGKEAEYAYMDSLFGQGNVTVGGSYYDEYLETRITYPFQCGIEEIPQDTLDLVYAPYQAPEDTVEYYRIHVAGAWETVNHIICES